MSDGFDEEEDGPAENEIEDDGETWILQPPEDLVEDAEDGQEPDDAEARPSLDEQVVLDQLHADGRVARSNENVDGDVVEFAQNELAFGARFPEMIGYRGQIHQEHAYGEEGYTEGILPVFRVSEPDQHPRDGEHHEQAHEVGDSVEALGRHRDFI